MSEAPADAVRRAAPGLALALARSALSFLATLGGATLGVLALLSLAPGDAADLQGAADPELNAALRSAWGLDQSVQERFFAFLGGVARGDLGESLTYRPGQPVAELVRASVGESAPLLLSALALCIGVGAGLALLSAGRSRAPHRLVRLLSVAPVFLLAFVAMSGLNEWAFAGIQEGWLERPEWFALPDTDSTFKRALAVLVLALGSSALAEVHQATAAELREIRRSGYVLAARARGAPTWPHVGLNLLPPLSGVAASRTAFFVGGLVVIEKVLQLNGAGAMLWQACRMRDIPLALSLTLVAAATVCAARLLADLARLALDPRQRELR
ncbi:MAG: ABC transporter permease [Alphaproteobacteria bacterium]|nr:ABC transporter permease [Alphaproteobacteria bacterium]